MRSASISILVVFLGFLLSTVPLHAGDDGEGETRHEAVSGFVENIYDMQKLGLKDLSAVLDTPIFRGSGLFKHIKVMVYCKTPDRHRLDIKGLPEETRVVYLKLMKPIATLTRYLFGLGSILVKVLEDSDIEVVKEEGLFKITALPRTKKLRKEFKKIVLWVDETFKPVRIYQESPDLGNITVRPVMFRKEGKFLLSGLKVKGVKGIEGEIQMKIKYEKVEKYWLPGSVKLKISRGEKEPKEDEKGQEFFFKEYKINKGLDDSLFGKEGEKKEESEEEDGF